ncbi:unnamed protein product [Closterium sp. Naga37s-1]|nr:unnamed protein product [Closterium sp. Naga37s-1]
MASTLRTLSTQLLPKSLRINATSQDAGCGRDCSRALRFRYPRTNQSVARSPLAATRITALSRTSPSCASILGNQTPPSGKHLVKSGVRVAAVATEEGEEGDAVCLASADRPPFDLNLAVLLAGFAFESYNTPQEDKETLWEEDVGGCRTIFTSYGFAYELYSGQLIVAVQSASDVPAVDLWGTSDPYVQASVGEASVRTRTIWTSTAPEWNEEIRLLVKADDTSPKYLKLSMWDDGIVIAPRRLGNASIRLDDLLDGETHEHEVALEGPGGGATLKLAVRYRSFAELAEEERRRWRLPSLDDIFSGQLPLVSGFQDVITSALQPPSTTPAADSSPAPTDGSAPATSQPSPAISTYEFVRSAIQQFGAPSAFPTSLDKIRDSVVPPQSPPQAAAAAAATGSAEISAENADTGSSGREEQVRQAVGLAREVLLRAGWIPPGGTLDQLSQAVMSGTDSGTGASGSSSSSSNSESAPAAASGGFDLGSAASAAAGGLLEGAAGAVAGRIEQRRAELRRSLTDMGITLPWYDQNKGQGANGQSSSSGAAAAAGEMLEGATNALVGRIEQRRAELRKSLVDLGITLPWYDQSSGQGADGQGADRQASPATDVTASQEPSSFSSSLDDLRKAAFRQTEGVLGSLALLGSTAGSLPLVEGETKSVGAAKPEGETGGEESEGASEGVSEGASEGVSEEEEEEALRMFGSAETAVEAWTMLASSLGQQTFVKSEFDKVCFIDHPQSDTQVAVWRDVRRKRIVVAFRGTEQTKLKDLLTDISLSPSSLDFERTSSGDFDQEVMVHGGFLAAYDSVRARLRSLIAIITDPNRPAPLTAHSADADTGADADSSIHAADSLSKGDTWRVYLTGHSLGGALSTLFAYELSQSNLVRERNIHLTMYNYGSPRVGNAAFVARFNVYMRDSWRIVNRADIVPTVPKLMGYRHVCCPVYLSPGGPSGDLQSDASQEQLGVDDGYAAEVVGEANANDILEDYMKGERRLIDRLLQTEVAMLSALRDGSAIMMHMEDFYYIALLKKVRESLGVSHRPRDSATRDFPWPDFASRLNSPSHDGEPYSPAAPSAPPPPPARAAAALVGASPPPRARAAGVLRHGALRQQPLLQQVGLLWLHRRSLRRWLPLRAQTATAFAPTTYAAALRAIAAPPPITAALAANRGRAGETLPAPLPLPVLLHPPTGNAEQQITTALAPTTYAAAFRAIAARHPITAALAANPGRAGETLPPPLPNAEQQTATACAPTVSAAASLAGVAPPRITAALAANRTMASALAARQVLSGLSFSSAVRGTELATRSLPAVPLLPVAPRGLGVTALFSSRKAAVPAKSVPATKLRTEDGIFGTSGGFGFTKANELFVGRVAMLGFAASLLGEAITGAGILSQLNIETGIPITETEPLLLFFIAFTVLGAIGGLGDRGRFVDDDAPAGPPVKPGSFKAALGLSEDGPLFGFTKANELFVGRLAQLGFAASLIGEVITGRGALAQLNIEIGVPVWELEPLLLASIAFFFVAAINPGTGRFINDDE